jgi:hypothetical protein
MMERMNSTMIYCKNFYKCHNVPPVQQEYNEKRKKQNKTKTQKKNPTVFLYTSKKKREKINSPETNIYVYYNSYENFNKGIFVFGTNPFYLLT